jgi:DNA-binding transcriptional LysR family regulator
MELRHLRYFVRVASELHFGRAAEQLGISQPPLSQQIRLLETELGVQLFERSSRRVRLTVPGRLFLEEAKATLDQAEHAISVTRRAASGEVGEIGIGLSASALFMPIFSESVTAFRRRYPDVHIDLTERSVAAQREGVASGTLDIGLVRSGRRLALPNNVTATPLAIDRMYVAMPAGHRLATTDAPICVKELGCEPMVHYPFDREGFQEDLRRLFGSVGLSPNLVQETHEMSTLLGLVSAGLGITVLPGSLRRLHIANLHYREVSGSEALSRMWLIHNHVTPRATTLAFLDVILPRVGELTETATLDAA